MKRILLKMHGQVGFHLPFFNFKFQAVKT